MIQYEKLHKITREKAESKLKVLHGEDLCRLLLSMCELEDWKWVQDTYLRFVRNNDYWVAAAAVTGLGHLARTSGELEKDKVIGILEDVARSVPELEGKVDGAISDINMFV